MRVSGSGYYAWLRRGVSLKKARDNALVVKILEAHGQSSRRYGYRRIHQTLRRNGEEVGRNRVARVMAREGTRPWYQRKRPKYRADAPECPAAPNRLDRNFQPGEPNRVWLADLTELPTPDGKDYLATVEDLGSRMIVGYALASRMTAELPF